MRGVDGDKNVSRKGPLYPVEALTTYEGIVVIMGLSVMFILWFIVIAAPIITALYGVSYILRHVLRPIIKGVLNLIGKLRLVRMMDCIRNLSESFRL